MNKKEQPELSYYGLYLLRYLRKLSFTIKSVWAMTEGIRTNMLPNRKNSFFIGTNDYL